MGMYLTGCIQNTYGPTDVRVWENNKKLFSFKKGWNNKAKL